MPNKNNFFTINEMFLLLNRNWILTNDNQEENEQNSEDIFEIHFYYCYFL